MRYYDMSKIHKKEIVCPKCNSKRIFKFRLDSDWASGAGDYLPVNSEEYYTTQEIKFDSFDRPDIDIYHCLDCGALFE